MTVKLINPSTGLPLKKVKDELRDSTSASFPIVNGIPRLAPVDNYAESLGCSGTSSRRRSSTGRRAE